VNTLKTCVICKFELTEQNIARWDIPNTYKDKTIRKDSLGREWCQKCTDEFDSIDHEN
jgi:hypothetical protein